MLPGWRRRLRALRWRLGRGLVLVTHDLGVAAEVADWAVVMYAGEIVEQGLVRDFLRRPVHSYTRRVLALWCERMERKRRASPTACRTCGGRRRGAFVARCPAVIGACNAAVPAEQGVGPGWTVRYVRVGELLVVSRHPFQSD